MIFIGKHVCRLKLHSYKCITDENQLHIDSFDCRGYFDGSVVPI